MPLYNQYPVMTLYKQYPVMPLYNQYPVMTLYKQLAISRSFYCHIPNLIPVSCLPKWCTRLQLTVDLLTACLCGICGAQSGTGQVFLPAHQCCCQCHSTGAPYSFMSPMLYDLATDSCQTAHFKPCSGYQDLKLYYTEATESGPMDRPTAVLPPSTTPPYISLQLLSFVHMNVVGDNCLFFCCLS
jgi:hypothetical protein